MKAYATHATYETDEYGNKFAIHDGKRLAVINLDSKEYRLGNHDAAVAFGRAIKAGAKAYRRPEKKELFAKNRNYAAGYDHRIIELETAFFTKNPTTGRFAQTTSQAAARPESHKKSKAYKLGHRLGYHAETKALSQEPYKPARINENALPYIKTLLSAEAFAKITPEMLVDDEFINGWIDGRTERHHKWENNNRLRQGKTRSSLGARIGPRGYGDERKVMTVKLGGPYDDERKAMTVKLGKTPQGR
ncbi:MAG: hypothetical protein LBH41_01205 [Rickettsiales bacterium]|jgi:hypothetical protein|nr:hypothetical protein [Rickettsiales bacterium]